MNDAPDNNTITTCANCGKGEETNGDLKACTACKLVKYCNRECQIAHRPLHKKACKKRAAELHDEALFKEPPPPEDCPICLLPMERGNQTTAFHSCCGKVICIGCIHAMVEEACGGGGDNNCTVLLCPFCRKPAPSSEEAVKQIKKLMEADNAYAFFVLGVYHEIGDMGVPQDMTKANELWLRAGELGCADAYFNLGVAYDNGSGVAVDKKKAKHLYELAAMKGSVLARHNLGCVEVDFQRAMKHFVLAARAGDKNSLDIVQFGFRVKYVTKDEYANTLRAYQKIRDEMKSDMRDKARASRNGR